MADADPSIYDRERRALFRFMRANTYRDDWTAIQLSRFSGIPLEVVKLCLPRLVADGYVLTVRDDADQVYSLPLEHRAVRQ